jgi:hypothetical protein
MEASTVVLELHLLLDNYVARYTLRRTSRIMNTVSYSLSENLVRHDQSAGSTNGV